MIDRRTLLKQLGLFTGGMMILPACNFDSRKVSIALNNLNITVAQEDLMKQLVDTLIPNGELLGAQALEVDKFVWVMADDCLKEEQQLRFTAGLSKFNELFKSKTEEDFIDDDEEIVKKRLPFIKEIMAQDAPEPPPLPSKEKTTEEKKEQVEIPVEQYLAYIQEFVGTVKGFSIRGYLQSEYIMRDIMPYALVPGKAENCKTIDPSQKVNLNG